MSDTTPGGFADTPGPEATPAQDADVRALLAFLRDEPLEMPPEVAARLDAVLAEERRAAAAAAGSASALGDPSDASPRAAARPTAPVTVLPSARRGPTMRGFAIVGGIAAAAVVVLGGIAVVGNLGPGGSSASLSAGGSAAPEAAAGSVGTRVTASGATYSSASIADQARTLAALSLDQATAAKDAAASAEPAPAGPAAADLTPEKVGACVRALTDGDGTVAVAVDAGTYAGKPALLVVLPTKDDPHSLDVFVVTRDCSPDFLTFARIARP